MNRIVSSDAAPAAIGPYSQAIIANGFVFTAGQIALDPATGQVIAGGVAEQTEQVLKNLTAVLQAAGSSWKNVVKTTVFLKDMNDFGAMNEVYVTFFRSHPPARSAFGTNGLALGARLELECMALRKSG